MSATSALHPQTKRSGDIVTPRPLTWRHRVGAYLIYVLIRLVGATLRLQWQEYEKRLSPPRQAIYCLWHNRLPIAMFMHWHCKKRLYPGLPVAAIVSASKDGGVVARILRHFEITPVRGSSSRRGAQALRELTTLAKQGYCLSITPDGPRGPKYSMHDGVIALSQLTGLEIIPLSTYLPRKLVLKTWDEAQIPIPFSRCVVNVGKPLSVPRYLTEEERECLRQQLQTQLKTITRDD